MTGGIEKSRHLPQPFKEMQKISKIVWWKVMIRRTLAFFTVGRNTTTMTEIDKIISDYLNAENTDYAIMINGNWGCGKTYYLNNDFKKVVEGIVAPKSILNKATQKVRHFLGKNKQVQDEGVHYKPAYISLYGLSSAEDFYQRVFLGVNGWANNGVIRFLGFGASKAIEYIGASTSGKDAKVVTYIDTNRVLVFDDLERICEDKISIKEVLGLINSYSEHNKRKVVIVCNEIVFIGDDVNEEKVNDYKKYKEKSVRFTYNYQSDVAVVFDKVVNRVKDDSYKQYLITNKSRLLYVFDKGGNNNLRTLIFFIDSFKQIYDEVIDVEYEENVLYNLMVTMFLYTMEYKVGVAADELKSLNPANYTIDASFWDFQKSDKNDKQEEQRDYQTEFNERYSELTEYFINNDVFIDYILDGYLDTKELKKEIRNVDETIGRRIMKPEGVAFQQLRNYSSLEDDQVLPTIEKLLGYVDEDKYNIYDLMYVFSELVKCDYWHFGGFNLSDEIKNRIIKSMNRQKLQHVYTPMFEMKIPMWNSDDNSNEYQVYQEMKIHAMKLNLEAKTRDNIKDANAFMDAAVMGNVKALSEFRLNPEKTISTSCFDWKKIWEMIDKGSNPLACELCNCVIFLTSIGHLQQDDARKIRNEFRPLLENYKAKDDHRIRAMYIEELKKHICGSLIC